MSSMLRVFRIAKVSVELGLQVCVCVCGVVWVLDLAGLFWVCGWEGGREMGTRRNKEPCDFEGEL